MPTGDFPDPKGYFWSDARGWVSEDDRYDCDHNRLLCPAREFLLTENEQLRAALRLAHGVLTTLVAPNPRESAIHIYSNAVIAEAKARALLSP